MSANAFLIWLASLLFFEPKSSSISVIAENIRVYLGKCQRSCRLEGGTTNETGKRKEALDS